MAELSCADVEVCLDELALRTTAALKDFANLKQSAAVYRRKLDGTPSLWPVRGRISSGFGRRLHPITRRMHYHAGVDIVVPVGTPVHATAAGRVVFAGWRAGYGLCVEIDHGYGLRTLYAHLSRAACSRGRYVAKGAVVAYSGSTGTSTGPHVHYEVRRGGSPVNPTNYMR